MGEGSEGTERNHVYFADKKTPKHHRLKKTTSAVFPKFRLCAFLQKSTLLRSLCWYYSNRHRVTIVQFFQSLLSLPVRRANGGVTLQYSPPQSPAPKISTLKVQRCIPNCHITSLREMGLVEHACVSCWRPFPRLSWCVSPETNKTFVPVGLIWKL